MGPIRTAITALITTLCLAVAVNAAPWTVEDVAVPGPELSDWDIAADGEGNVVLVVVANSVERGSTIYVTTRSAEATTFGRPVELYNSGDFVEGSLADRRYVDIEVSQDGHAVVLWVGQDGIEVLLGDIRAGTWGRSRRFGTPLSGDVVAGISDSGVATVAWTTSTFEGTGYRQHATSVRGDARSDVWERPAPVGPPRLDSELELAVNRAGDAILAWSRCVRPSRRRCLHPGRDDLLLDAARVLETASRPATGTAWEPKQLVASGRYLINWDVSLDDRGDAIAVWQRPTRTGVGGAVLASVRMSGGAWPAPGRISSSAARFRRSDYFNAVGLATSDRGETLAAWVASTPDGEIIETAVLAEAAGRWSQPMVAQAPCAHDCLGELALAGGGDLPAVGWSVPASAESGREGPFQLYVLVESSAGRVAAPPLEAGWDEFRLATALSDAVVAWADLDPGSLRSPIHVATHPVPAAAPAPQRLLAGSASSP